MLLEKITKENDIKKIRKEDYRALAEEIRQFLIQKISVTGGAFGVQSGRSGADNGSASEFESARR